MRKIACPKCGEYMYLAGAKMGLDLTHMPHHDGLKARLTCDNLECGHVEDGLFFFARFASEPLTKEEIGRIYQMARNVRKRTEPKITLPPDDTSGTSMDGI